jgi:hypothetical protein
MPRTAWARLERQWTAIRLVVAAIGAAHAAAAKSAAASTTSTRLMALPPGTPGRPGIGHSRLVRDLYLQRGVRDGVSFTRFRSGRAHRGPGKVRSGSRRSRSVAVPVTTRRNGCSPRVKGIYHVGCTDYPDPTYP